MRNRTLALALLAFLVAGTLFASGSGEKRETSPAVKLYNEGVALLKQDDYAGAQVKFERALALKENFPEAHNNLAYSMRKQGAANYAEALRHYNRAIELDPRLAEAYEYRGVLYVLQGEKEKAMADLATLRKLNPGLANDLEAAIEAGAEPDKASGIARKIW